MPTDFSFNNYFEWLIPWEGADYENDPSDPGGPTRYGIDQRSHPDVNIRALTKEKARAIYWDDYWLPATGQRLPVRTSWAVMDAAVNCGVVRAVKWLQSACGAAVDGRLGPLTLDAAHDREDAALATAVLDQREAYYRLLGQNPKRRKYLKGWLNRNNNLRKALA